MDKGESSRPVKRKQAVTEATMNSCLGKYAIITPEHNNFWSIYYLSKIKGLHENRTSGVFLAITGAAIYLQ
jgi:hypothetical protein